MRRKPQPTDPPTKLAVRVLFLREGESWVAQCIEFDIAAQGRTLLEAEHAFARTIVGQIMLDLRKGKDPLQGIRAAPRMYWRKFQEALRLGVEPTIGLPKSVPPAFVIEEIRQEARVAG